MNRLEQLSAEIALNIETQYHINPEQGDWHNFTNCYDYHIVTANNSILVPYEDDKILKMISATKRFLSDMCVDRDLSEPYCYELNYFLEILTNPADILYYDR